MLYNVLARIRWIRTFCARVLEARGQQLMRRHPQGSVDYRMGSKLWEACASHRNTEANRRRNRGR